jgi:hypothetical protein
LHLPALHPFGLRLSRANRKRREINDVISRVSVGKPDFRFFRSTHWITTRNWNVFSQEGQVGIGIQPAVRRKSPDLVGKRFRFMKVNLKIK